MQTYRTAKSPRFDDITVKALKAGEDCIITRMCGFWKQVWNFGIVWKDWKMVEVVCIPKKGNLAECDNWRGVTLLSNPGKVYCMIILNQIYDTVDNEL